MEYFIAFFGMVLFDVAYALFNRALARNNVAIASCLSGVITALMGTVIFEYTSNHLALAAAVLGSVAGTWFGMFIDKTFFRKI